MAAGEQEDRGPPRVILKGGASFVGSKPVFSADSKYLLVVSGFVIRVLSVKSGECVRILKGHKSKITTICLHPSNNFQVYSSSQDQAIIKWDFTDGAILKRYKCPRKLLLLKPTHLESPQFIGIAEVWKSECYMVAFTLPTKDADVEFTTLESGLSADAHKLSFGCKNDIIACVQSRSLTVRSITSSDRKQHELSKPWRKYEKVPKFTVVACHPNERCIATGNKRGAILLWYNFMSDRATTTTLHWHALPLRALSFTTEGSYLLSGGHECVLVKWQHNTQHKDTLPRLGAPIINIVSSHDNLHYAVCHSDNSIQLINSQFRVTQVYVGLTQANFDNANKDPVPVGLKLDPRTSALVLNGKPGHLQFYNLHTDKQLYCLDIVCQNYISPENLCKPLHVTEVICADFSTNGDWLITAEYRNDEETTPEQRLKFWMYDAKQQTYTLNTSAETPHSERIKKICFRPTTADLSNEAPTVVTTGHDGSFKTWRMMDDTDIYRSRSCWSCESVGYYRGQSAGDAAFSEDGSVLAVAFDSTLTLWDPDTNGLHQAFPMKKDIRKVIFGTGRASHMLAVVMEKKLSAFNLLTCSVSWSIPMRAGVVCRHDPTGHIAVFCSVLEKQSGTQLVILDLTTPEPVYKHSLVDTGKIKAAIFVPHARPFKGKTRLPWQHYSQLYFLNHQQELLMLTEEPEVVESQVKVTDRLPETPFSLILSEERRRKLQAPQPQRYAGLHGTPGSQYLKEMLNTPAHVLPPVSSLCASFMDRLMLSKKSLGNAKILDEDDDDDSDSRDGNSDSDSESDMEVDTVVEKQPATQVEPPSDTRLNLSSTKDFSQIKPDMMKWLGNL